MFLKACIASEVLHRIIPYPVQMYTENIQKLFSL